LTAFGIEFAFAGRPGVPASVTTAQRGTTGCVTEPLTKSQMERLGVRLLREGGPQGEDLVLLLEVLARYSDVLGRAIVRVSGDLGVASTSRIKSTGTILEKLDRYGGSWLKSIQDLAGMRIVGDFDRRGQDVLVERLVTLFADAPRSPKVVDRRAEPMHGYSAVHVIVFPEDVPIEIQVRTCSRSSPTGSGAASGTASRRSTGGTRRSCATTRRCSVTSTALPTACAC
jgi:hypothetical protein